LKKILLFGAGKIGRSFIGQLFSQGGFEVVFVDVYEKLIDALNAKRSYPVIIKSDEGEKTLIIKNIRGLYLSEVKEILKEIESVSYIATAVGQSNLRDIIPLIAEGIANKLSKGHHATTDIIIAENLRNAAAYFEEKLRQYFTPGQIHSYIGLIETSIGKMVPIMTKADLDKDITQVFAEPYNTLILDKKGFLNPLPDIPGLAPKDNMKAWVDRKSFIHNLGHAAAVYYGFLKHPQYKYLYEVLADPDVEMFARSAMRQSGKILQKMYPGEFSDQDIIDHIEDLLFRFQNKNLGDTVFRVGMDLFRKLGKEDRLAGAIHLGLTHEMPYNKILYALVCGLYFRAKNEQDQMFPEDARFVEMFSREDFIIVLEKICGFNPTIHKEVIILSENYRTEILKRFKIEN
jgi:mannitol-1-phosphate 5-dehydrogenase